MTGRVLAVLLVCGAVAYSAPARIQATTGGADGVGTTSITTNNFPSSSTSGNTILVFVRNASDTMTGVSDTLATSYSEAAHVVTGGATIYGYVGLLHGSGTNAVTATFSSNTNYGWVKALEISSIATASPVDVTATGSGSGVSDLVSNAFSTTMAGDYVALAASQNTFTTYTAATNFTLVDGAIPHNTNDFGGVEEYIPAGTLSSYVAHITSGATNSYALLAVALKPATGGGGRRRIMVVQ